MSDQKDNSSSLVSRRTAIRGVAVSTIGVAGLASYTGYSRAETTEIPDVDPRNKIEITVADYGDQGVRTEEVPVEWYNRYSGLTTLKKEVRKSVQSQEAFTGIGIGTSDRTIGGYRVPHITVLETTSGAVDIPDKIDGIKVESRRIGTPSFNTCTSCFEQPPGGMAVETGDGNGNQVGAGTTGWKINDGSDYMLTAAHIFDCSGTDDITGYVAASTGTLNRFGEVVDYDHSEDWALLTKYNLDIGCPSGGSNEFFDAAVRNEGGPANGNMTEDGLRTMKDDGTPNRNRGRNTCEDSGLIDMINTSLSGIQCPNSDATRSLDNLVMTKNTNTGGGDSGSFWYNHSYNSGGYCYDNLATHIHSGSTGTGESFGVAADLLREQYNFNYNPDGLRC